MTKRTKTRAKATKDTGQTYEAQRLKRIKENQALLAGLGIHVSTSAQRAQEKSKRPRRKRKPNALKQLKPCKPKKPERRSRRNLGLDPENVKGFANEAVKFIDETPVEDEEARDKRLLEKWQLHVKELESGESPVKGDSQRRLFLVPTGVPGVNDHTLKEPVASLQSYLWGFCEGLFARIFQKVRPGDVFLFTSSGCGEFNRIARVRETRVVTKAVADTFWSRMKFSMGGSCKNNVGFPLLCLIDKPVELDWEKMEVMRLLGYRDHLQSSRHISSDRLQTTGGKTIIGQEP